LKRIIDTPRSGWRQTVESQGLSYHTHTQSGVSQPYWFEGAYYEFTLEEIDRIEKASNDLHAMSIRAAERIIEKGWITTRLALPESAVPLILDSGEKDEKTLYGRFDFSYNPSLGEDPKLLEYNADTPTGLLEAAVIQWFWLEDKFRAELAAKRVDQFNSIHESLIDAWKQRSAIAKIHFTGCTGVPEDFQTLVYLADTASQAGKKIAFIDITRIGWKATEHRFWAESEPLEAAFKLYPWENLFTEEFSPYLGNSPTTWIEPAWKILVGNKAILPILWEMFPDHPNLLPAYAQSKPLGESFVKKALYAREGANILIRRHGVETSTGGNYSQGPFIFQAYYPTPAFSGSRPAIGSWIINHEAHGMGIREADSDITDNFSRFVPHVIRG
jgi:glutathionylspermidine synthase